jgi:hypothetical protein
MERFAMIPIDAKASADAHAVATSAFLLALIDQLIAKNVLDRADIVNGLRSAMQGISGRIQTASEGFEAAQILQALLMQFAKS